MDIEMKYISKYLICLQLTLMLRGTLAIGEMFVKEAIFYKIENGDQFVGKPLSFGKVSNEKYCTIKCSEESSCTGVSYEGEHCTGIMTFTYPAEGVVYNATSTYGIYRKDQGPPEMCINFESMFQVTLNGAVSRPGYIGQGLQFTASVNGNIGQPADAGIWKGKACFVTTQTCSNGFTFSMWAKMSTLNLNDHGFVTTFEANTEGMNIRKNGIYLHFYMRLQSAEYAISVDYTGHWAIWTHITLSMAAPGSNLNIYYNGAYQTSKSAEHLWIYATNSGRLVFGRRDVDVDNFYGTAVIDEVCSWNIMLSHSEILRVYQN